MDVVVGLTASVEDSADVYNGSKINDTEIESNTSFAGAVPPPGPATFKHQGASIIFDEYYSSLLIGIYGFILVLGLTFNAAMIWVIFARERNRNPRNMYIANLAVSGIIMTLVCVPPTVTQILYGGWWHFGLIACKLVPAIQGANILVSAFTITVIAVDRWKSVSNTNPGAENLSYCSALTVIAVIWLAAFVVVSPLLLFQRVNRMTMPGYPEFVIMQVCTEAFPAAVYKHAFTVAILLVQYVVPLIVLPVVHTKILVFLRTFIFILLLYAVFHTERNSGFQTDARRREREVKRNKRMTMVLSCIGIIFAVSWMPLHLYLILTDIFFPFQDNQTFFLVLGLCHTVAMTSAFTNPVMYGWFNTNLRADLESLLPSWCTTRLQAGSQCLVCGNQRRAASNGNEEAANGGSSSPNGHQSGSKKCGGSGKHKNGSEDSGRKRQCRRKRFTLRPGRNNEVVTSPIQYSLSPTAKPPLTPTPTPTTTSTVAGSGSLKVLEPRRDVIIFFPKSTDEDYEDEKYALCASSSTTSTSNGAALTAPRKLTTADV